MTGESQSEPFPGIFTQAPGVRFWHGTKAVLSPGDVLTPDGADQAGRRDDLGDGYVFFTDSPGLAAIYGNGSPGTGSTRDGYVYQVEPIGPYEPDPAEEGQYTRILAFRSIHGIRVVRLAAVCRMPYGSWEHVGDSYPYAGQS